MAEDRGENASRRQDWRHCDRTTPYGRGRVEASHYGHGHHQGRGSVCAQSGAARRPD